MLSTEAHGRDRSGAQPTERGLLAYDIREEDALRIAGMFGQSVIVWNGKAGLPNFKRIFPNRDRRVGRTDSTYTPVTPQVRIGPVSRQGSG